MVDEVLGTCVVCNKGVMKGVKASKKVDGIWLCSVQCKDTFLAEKKKWAPEHWKSICRLQVLYEERKRAETSQIRNSSIG